MQHIFVTRIYPKRPDVYKISVGHKNVTGICYTLLIIKFAKHAMAGLLFILTEQAIITYTACFKKCSLF